MAQFAKLANNTAAPPLGLCPYRKVTVNYGEGQEIGAQPQRKLPIAPKGRKLSETFRTSGGKPRLRLRYEFGRDVSDS
jgi:hypothetical protein